ncbi:MvaI/BcnI family restriction endonuclease [Candidatus Poriferisocius sp.]|uniref:MvaI/BcnI family restriction endonuclease n=1 Tax=Candidatus Poriferisocius sp. TaxID=3101276 RepID=UPI003B021C22
MTDAEFFARVKEITQTGYWELGEKHGGTGGVGKLLEELLDVDGGNSDTPDEGRWEIKTHTGQGTLLTLFHKTGTPNMSCILESDYSYYPNGDMSKPITYRNTVYGGAPNSQGFFADTSHSMNRVTLFNINDNPRVAYSSWSYDDLMTAFSYKLRRLLLVNATKSGQKAAFGPATAYSDPYLRKFPDMVANGDIAIDLDARYQSPESSAIRDHGTKFRIAMSNLTKLYKNIQKI